MKRAFIVPALLIAAGVATTGGLVYSQPPDAPQDHAIANLVNVKISLTQAVLTAEQYAGGRATRAELENENGHTVYGVKVSTNTDGVYVKVDATNGTVVSAQPAQRSENHAHEERDDD